MEIRTEGLSHVYSAGTPFEQTAVKDVSLTVPSGQFLAVIGHTGSGKSTFIQHLNGLLQPSAGRVLLDGEDINRDKKSRREAKWHVGMVFQYPEYQLFEETVRRDIGFGPRNMGLSEAQIEERVREAARFVNIEEKLLEVSPLELSGGQKRRIAIAGVIAMRPEILVLDEPTAGLDPSGCARIFENICRYREASGATVILVTHSMDDAARLCDRVAVFREGSLFLDGTPAEVFSRGEELRATGLALPHAAELAAALRRRGVPLEKGIFTHEQLVKALVRQKEGSTC